MSHVSTIFLQKKSGLHKAKKQHRMGENKRNLSLSSVAQPNDLSLQTRAVTKVTKQVLVINTTKCITSTILTLHILLL